VVVVLSRSSAVSAWLGRAGWMTSGILRTQGPLAACGSPPLLLSTVADVDV